jgi:hypothetical protein
MRILFFGRANARLGKIIRSWKPILALLFIFIISCGNRTSSQTVQIQFAKPINGFTATIYWTPKSLKIHRYFDREMVVGKAILELERTTDKVKYKVDYNLLIDTLLVDSDFKKSMYECFVNNNLPEVIAINNEEKKEILDKEDPLSQERNEPFFFFKDVNFDGNDELLLVEEDLKVIGTHKTWRVFEFKDGKLVEFLYFPPDVFACDRDRVGSIDYVKKEIRVNRLRSCCGYETDFYRLGKNSKNKFILYKTETIKQDKPIITKYYKE